MDRVGVWFERRGRSPLWWGDVRVAVLSLDPGRGRAGAAWPGYLSAAVGGEKGRNEFHSDITSGRPHKEKEKEKEKDRERDKDEERLRKKDRGRENDREREKDPERQDVHPDI